MIETANRLVKKYTQGRTMNAITRAEDEKHGNGCGCSTCAKFWVNEANEWIQFSVPEESQFSGKEIYRFEIDKGRTVVRGGFSDIGKDGLKKIQKRLGKGDENE